MGCFFDSHTRSKQAFLHDVRAVALIHAAKCHLACSAHVVSSGTFLDISTPGPRIVVINNSVVHPCVVELQRAAKAQVIDPSLMKPNMKESLSCLACCNAFIRFAASSRTTPHKRHTCASNPCSLWRHRVTALRHKALSHAAFAPGS